MQPAWTSASMIMYPLKPRDSGIRDLTFRFKRRQNLDPRLSATPPSRWTITPLFYSQSIDLPVLRKNEVSDGGTGKAPDR